MRAKPKKDVTHWNVNIFFIIVETRSGILWDEIIDQLKGELLQLKSSKLEMLQNE